MVLPSMGQMRELKIWDRNLGQKFGTDKQVVSKCAGSKDITGCGVPTELKMKQQGQQLFQVKILFPLHKPDKLESNLRNKSDEHIFRTKSSIYKLIGKFCLVCKNVFADFRSVCYYSGFVCCVWVSW